MHRCSKDPRTRDLTHVKNWTTCSIVIYSLRVFFESNIQMVWASVHSSLSVRIQQWGQVKSVALEIAHR